MMFPISCNLDTKPDCVNVSFTGGGRFLFNKLFLKSSVENGPF